MSFSGHDGNTPGIEIGGGAAQTASDMKLSKEDRGEGELPSARWLCYALERMDLSAGGIGDRGETELAGGGDSKARQ